MSDKLVFPMTRSNRDGGSEIRMRITSTVNGFEVKAGTKKLYFSTPEQLKRAVTEAVGEFAERTIRELNAVANDRLNTENRNGETTINGSNER